MTEQNTGIDNLLKEIQEGLKRTGVLSAEQTTSFNQQVENLRETRMADKHDGDKGGAEKQVGMALSAAKSANIVEAARRIARKLAENGVVSIDDVTIALRKEGYESIADVDANNRRFWKGSVFATAEWACVGEIPSIIAANHGRPVKQWALKTWLKKNSLNGTNLKGSAFNTIKTYTDFQKANPGVVMAACNWYIGTASLSAAVDGQIKAENNHLYGAPVTFVLGAIGGLLMPPQPLQPGQEIPVSTPVKGPTTL